MKTVRLSLPMVGLAIWLQIAALASQSDSTLERAASQAIEKSSGDHSSNVQGDGEGRGSEIRTSPAQAKSRKHSASVKRTPTRRRPSATRSGLALSQNAPAGKTSMAKNTRSGSPGNVAALRQSVPNSATNIPYKAVNRPPVLLPPQTVAVSGQQFRNSRDPGARLATSGGPLTAARGTAVIDGTRMKRKP